MHIWYMHHYGGGSGIGLYDRPFRLATAWRKQSHSATIFIASFHHLLEKNISLPSEMTVEGEHYVCVPCREYSSNGVRRLLNMWDFCKGLYRMPDEIARNLPRPDAIIVSSPHPFAIFPARALARRFGAKLVFEIRDLWPLSITEIAGTSKWHPFVMLCRFTEWFALTRSDLIASVLPRASRYLAGIGYGKTRFVWVPNGIADTNPPAMLKTDEGREAKAVLDAWRAEDRTTIIYTGSIGTPNAVDLLVEAMAHGSTLGGDRCAALIVGSGEQLSVLKAYASEKKLANVHFSGRLPKSDAVALLQHADIGYAGLRNIEKLFGFGISPNKIADYFQASLPVFLPLEPCGDPVSESGGGIARAAETPQAVWEGLWELISMSPAQRREMGARGQSYVSREYDYRIVAERYAKAISS